MVTQLKGTSLKLETQRQYNYWQALVLSFFSDLLYWDVYKRWRGIGLLYLLLMTWVFCIPFSIKYMIGMDHFFNDVIIKPFQKIPDIPYVSGKLKFDKKMPYFIKNDRGQVETILDNTGSIKKFDQSTYPSLRFLFLDDRVYYTIPDAFKYFEDRDYQRVTEVKEIKMPSDTSFVFNGESFLKAYQIRGLKMLTLTVIYPVVAATYFTVALIFLLAFAMMGQIVSQTIFKVQLYYKQSCRLLFVASTPAFFVLQIMAVCGYNRSMMGYVWLALVATYFSFAIIFVKRNLRSIARL
ncbi:DUF1189 family protein [Legionella sp. W05-934-2]|jgi:hypothetical protein|uniref:DUF1189 family protein n=1 Tax=Legionella sp. W05-934-2 TaxID=1198649 RepID=UPI003462280F